MKACAALLFVVLIALGGCSRMAAENAPVRLAAASSFRPLAQGISALVMQKCGTSLQFSTGSTGRLTVQVLNGAPYDVFVAVGEDAPSRLAQAHLVRQSTVLAQSPLVLYSPAGKNPKDGALALARPNVAPYGAAAEQALQYMQGQAGWALPQRRVYGQSTAQAFAFANSGAAQAALVPLSLVRAAKLPNAQWRPVPPHWYQPVRTHALLLSGRKSARCLYALLRSRELEPLLRQNGYRRP